MLTLTYEDTKKTLMELAAERPDYVYEIPNEEAGACVYRDPDGAPSCIVGHVFARLLPDFFKEISTEQEGDENQDSVIDVLVENDIAADEKTRQLLWMAQSQQDGGNTWGVAVEAAIAWAESGR